MQTRTTRTGLALTELGFGGAPLGNLYTEVTDEEAAGAVEAAWESGVRYFDTAPHYGVGLSERRLGALLARYPRDEYFLSTKVGRLLAADPGATGRDGQGFDVPATTKRVWGFSRDGVLRSVDESLERLGLDRIDILYVHDPDDHYLEASLEAVPALVELREQGVVSTIGVGMNQTELPARFIRETDVDLVMLAGRYTLLDQSGLDELLPLAEERGVGIVAAGVYNSGLLATDRPTTDAKYDYEDAPEDLVSRAHLLADIAESHGATLPEAAVAFPLRHPSVLSVVLGARDAAQVTSNVGRYRAPLPQELWDDLITQGFIAERPASKETK
ncbi:aldo/keto reductase [Frondihabitans sp. PAMC 28766]|uniref:aldo/keto reductase n=1 Tax=Frondihabitans sp. PAMC 28766 TaxID=1795630 RepID=UPI00078E1F25|nr:aldo/keto reductase [Frondihabitans sp. PAMC 28766]AMM21599.1 aldo/keto reductase [Frondihabitans sp. PAMC 28766]